MSGSPHVFSYGRSNNKRRDGLEFRPPRIAPSRRRGFVSQSDNRRALWRLVQLLEVLLGPRM